MKLDATVIINGKNEVLWLRSGVVPLAMAGQALLALQDKHPQQGLYVGRSFCNESGVEVRFEIANALALECAKAGQAVPAALVEVWHKRDFRALPCDEPSLVEKAEYVLAGCLLLPAAEGVLDQAFSLSQNIDAAWNPVKSCRSTSVGDIFVLTIQGEGRTHAHRVASFGFNEVEFGDTASRD